MKDDKMTLQQYIESRNYKRKLLSNSKSKQKYKGLNQNPSIAKLLPSPLNNAKKKINQIQKLPLMSQMANQLKQIDQTNESFSLIHKKVEVIKQFVRQFINNDKIFVNFCKKMFDLESCYRLELIQAYRYQLFRYQFDNKNMMDENKKKILKQLNEFYMNSKFQYKKVILKEEDPKKIQSKKSGFNNKGDQLKRQLSAEKDFFQSESKLPITSSVKAGKVLDSNIFTGALYRTRKQNQLIQNPCMKPKIGHNPKQQQNGLRYTRSPSSKKVVFIASPPLQQSTKQYEIPDFSSVKKSAQYNPQNLRQEQQSNIDIESEAESNDSQTKNMLKFMSKQSLQDKVFYSNEYRQQKIMKQNNRESKTKRTFRQIQSERQKQKLLQSKEQLKVQRN